MPTDPDARRKALLEAAEVAESLQGRWHWTGAPDAIANAIRTLIDHPAPAEPAEDRVEAVAVAKAIENLTLQLGCEPDTVHLTNECGKAILAALSADPLRAEVVEALRMARERMIAARNFLAISEPSHADRHLREGIEAIAPIEKQFGWDDEARATLAKMENRE